MRGTGFLISEEAPRGVLDLASVTPGRRLICCPLGILSSSWVPALPESVTACPQQLPAEPRSRDAREMGSGAGVGGCMARRSGGGDEVGAGGHRGGRRAGPGHPPGGPGRDPPQAGPRASPRTEPGGPSWCVKLAGAGDGRSELPDVGGSQAHSDAPLGRGLEWEARKGRLTKGGSFHQKELGVFAVLEGSRGEDDRYDPRPGAPQPSCPPPNGCSAGSRELGAGSSPAGPAPGGA